SRIKSDLFAKHPSFLSNPLLATMMLLTYDQFAEIPEKAYIFYEQAFDTLFLKHDATKEGFTRQKYTDLSIDEFKKYLSYFCLFSYYDEKYEFTEAETIEYIGKAIQATNTKLNKSDFYRDLIESVCIMQQDGLKTVFTHRTFQEFFCTYSLANFVDNKIEHILSHIVRRRSDNVIPMLFEMRRGKVEREFIIPKLTEIVKLGQEQNCGESLFTHAKLFNWYLGVRRPAKSAYSFVQYDEQGNGDIVNLLFKLYKDIGSPIKKNFPKYKKDDANILKELAAQKRLKLKIDEITIVFPD
ncbi:hypothetical protein, partial [Trichormus sp. NMC-1]|uniref:NACHT domain-containing protein n=1 Tax=Trichormus sp. NMC-1 TaxID=1853259 RepID=UPI00191C2CB6